MTPDKHTAKCPRCKRPIVQSKPCCPPVTRVVTFSKDTHIADILIAMASGHAANGVEVTTTEEV